MRAGRMRDSIIIETGTSESNNDGEPIVTFSEFATVRGALEELTVARKFELNGRVQEATARVMIRWESSYAAILIQPSRVQVPSLFAIFDVVGVTRLNDGRSAYLWLSLVR